MPTVRFQRLPNVLPQTASLQGSTVASSGSVCCHDLQTCHEGLILEIAVSLTEGSRAAKWLAVWFTYEGWTSSKCHYNQTFHSVVPFLQQNYHTTLHVRKYTHFL